jgi:cysteine-rich repeat protein
MKRCLFLLLLIIGCQTTGDDDKNAPCKEGHVIRCMCADGTFGESTCDAHSVQGECLPCPTREEPDLTGKPRRDGGQDEDPPPPRDRDADIEEGPRCGDGIVQFGEDCDDGNDDNSDGCDSACRLSGDKPFASNACPGLPVHVWPGAKPKLFATTQESGNRSVSTDCGSLCYGGSGSPDRVFKATAHATGKMTVTTTATTFNVLLYAVDSCPIGDIKPLVFANDNKSAGGETITFPVKDGTSYWVFVDGAGLPAQQGRFSVTFSID